MLTPFPEEIGRVIKEDKPGDLVKSLRHAKTSLLIFHLF